MLIFRKILLLRGFRLRVLVALALVARAAQAIAHEGHEPLPTKGAQVDINTGQITLSAEAHKALGVKTAEAQPRTIAERVLAYATVSLPWGSHHYVTTPIGGRIAKIHVKPGQHVKAGDVLAEVRSTELENVQLELLAARNKSELSRQTLDRTERLAKDQVVAGRELTAAQVVHRTNQNALEIARHKLRRLRLSDRQVDEVLRSRDPVSALPITAPISGVAIHSDLVVGRVVEPVEHLFEVMDLSQVAVRIDVLERDLHKIQPGQAIELTVNAFPRDPLRASVATKEAFLDPTTHLGRVWATLPNSSTAGPMLLPGMYGQAQIVVHASGKNVAVPREAVLSNGTELFVLVEEAATSRAFEYRKRNVAVGLRDGKSVEITAGEVFPGDRVVTTAGHQLANFFPQGVLRLSPEAQKNLGVRLEAVSYARVSETLEVDGNVDLPPEQRAVASSQLGGTIERILVERGQAVQAGEVIAEVSSLELQQIQLDLLQAHLQIRLLKYALDRLAHLKDSQAIARKQFLETESQHQAALLQRDNAHRRLETVGLSSEQIETVLTERKLVELLPIRAPIAGVVVQFDKALGQTVKADEQLFEIHNHERIWIQANLSERDLGRIPIGIAARVRISAMPGFEGEGTVVRSGSNFEEQNRTLSAWIELDTLPAEPLYHNMLARVTFIVDAGKPTLAVPKSAVTQQGSRSYVFVKQRDGILKRRAVEVGRADDRLVEVRKGLNLGEMIAVEGSSNLQTAYASLR